MKKIVAKSLNASADARIKTNKAKRIARHARRMAMRPADPKRGLTRFKRRFDKQRSYTDAHPGTGTTSQ